MQDHHPTQPDFDIANQTQGMSLKTMIVDEADMTFENNLTIAVLDDNEVDVDNLLIVNFDDGEEDGYEDDFDDDEDDFDEDDDIDEDFDEEDLDEDELDEDEYDDFDDEDDDDDFDDEDDF